MASRALIFLFALLAGWTAPAFAHGQEVLGTIFAQIATVISVFVGLGVIARLRRYWVAGMIGCLAGVVVSWWITQDMPYAANRAIITIADVLLPVLFGGLGIVAAKIYARHRGN